MRVSNYCSECVMHWAPYMTNRGCCPACGGGTVRRHEAVSEDAGRMFRDLSAARKRREAAERFEEFYFARELRLNGLDSLPVAEPKRAA